MGNIVRKEFTINGNFNVPAGVFKVKVSSSNIFNYNKSSGRAATFGMIQEDGSLYGWGYNQNGCIGVNSSAPVSLKELVANPNKFIHFSQGSNIWLFLDKQGFAYSCGTNGRGKLGINSMTPTSVSTPVLISTNKQFVYLKTDESTYESYVCGALDFEGNLYMWGANAKGQLGDNSVVQKSVPTLVVGGNKFIDFCMSGNNISDQGNTYAIDTNKNLWAWGDATFGQLGDGTLVSKSSPVLIMGSTKFRVIKAEYKNMFAIDTDGNLWAWGNNDIGQLGDGTTIAKSSPVLVLGGHNFIKVVINTTFGASVNASILALDTDGNIWAWGGNVCGQLGDGSTVPKSSPVLVLGGHNFKDLSFINIQSSSAAAALDINGNIWTWGDNSSGNLGDGTTIDKSSPVLVIGGHNFKNLVHSGPLANATMAFDNDNQAYNWGYNAANQLGDGTIFPKSSPTLLTGIHIAPSMSNNLEYSKIFDVTPGDIIPIVVENFYSKFGNNTISYLTNKIIVEYEQ